MKVFFGWFTCISSSSNLPAELRFVHPTSPTVPIPNNSDDDLHMLLQQNGDHTDDIRWSPANFIICSPSFSINPTNSITLFFRSFCFCKGKPRYFPFDPINLQLLGPTGPTNESSSACTLLAFRQHGPEIPTERTMENQWKSDGNNFSTAWCLASGQRLHSELENGWKFCPFRPLIYRFKMVIFQFAM